MRLCRVYPTSSTPIFLPHRFRGSLKSLFLLTNFSGRRTIANALRARKGCTAKYHRIIRRHSGHEVRVFFVQAEAIELRYWDAGARVQTREGFASHLCHHLLDQFDSKLFAVGVANLAP